MSATGTGSSTTDLQNGHSIPASKTLKQSLSGGENTKIRGLCANVAVEHSDQYGRHLVAKTDLAAGSLILIERPYSFVIHDHCGAFFCQHCAEPLPSQREKFLCKNCNDPKIVFCSPDCYNDALSHYHVLECALEFIGLTRESVLLAFRILLSTPIPTLLKYYNNRANPLAAESPIISFEQRFMSLMTLMPVDDELDDGMFTRVLKRLVLFLTKRLRKGEYLTYEQWPADMNAATRLTVCERILLDIMLRLRRNRQGVWEFRKIPDSKLMKAMKEVDCHKATAIYPIGALLNHSCAPNTHMSFGNLASIEIRVISNIKAGEQLTHNYGPRMGEIKRVERRQKLQEEYFFDCTCCACSSDEIELIEIEMTALKCSSCSKLLPENMVKCSECDLEVNLTDVNGKVTSLKTMLAVANVANTETLLPVKELGRCLDMLEKVMHPHNRVLNEMRSNYVDVLMKQEQYSEVEPILKRYVATVKRHFGSMTLKAAHAWRRLSRLYVHTNTAMYGVTVALVVRIYVNHYGRENVERLFHDGGMDDVVEMMQAMCL